MIGLKRDPGDMQDDHSDRRWGYTLIEVLTVIALIGIIIGIVGPMVSNLGSMRIREAARLLAADIEFAQMDSIAHPDDPRVLVIESKGGATYWIAPSSNTVKANAITEPISGEDWVVQFGTDRGAAGKGTVTADYNLGGDNTLGFDGLGIPDQGTIATITLEHGTHSIEIQIAPETGEVTIDTTP